MTQQGGAMANECGGDGGANGPARQTEDYETDGGEWRADKERQRARRGAVPRLLAARMRSWVDQPSGDGSAHDAHMTAAGVECGRGHEDSVEQRRTARLRSGGPRAQSALAVTCRGRCCGACRLQCARRGNEVVWCGPRCEAA